jgi:hypothetical protein
MIMQHKLQFLITDKQDVLVHRDYFEHQNYHLLLSIIECIQSIPERKYDINFSDKLAPQKVLLLDDTYKTNSHGLKA